VRDQPVFVVVHRAEFDAYLAERARLAGISIQENEPALEIRIVEEAAIVRTAQAVYRARVVVGADGSKGIARRVVQGRQEPVRTARALEILCPSSGDNRLFQNQVARFDFSEVRSELQGYIWDFPSRVENRPVLNRGIFDARLARRRPKARLPGLLLAALRQWEDTPAEPALAGHPIHRFSPRARLSAPRILLIGDCIGAEPLFGEGIWPALGTGQFAAEEVCRAFKRGEFSFHGYRGRLFRSQIGRYLLIRWAVAYVSYHLCDFTPFMHFMWTAGDLIQRFWPKKDMSWLSDQMLEPRQVDAVQWGE